MKAGKTLELLKINETYKRAINKRPLLLKPSVDDRWGSEVIKTRLGGMEEKCRTFPPNENIYDLILNLGSDEDLSCVLLDEAQFLTKDQVWNLCDIVDWLEIDVMCFGLRTDYNGNVFEGSTNLLGLADELIEIGNLCHCGNSATMNIRFDETTGEVLKDSGEDNIHIGDGQYAATCRKDWKSGIVGKNYGRK